MRTAPDGEWRGPRRYDPGRKSPRRNDFLANAWWHQPPPGRDRESRGCREGARDGSTPIRRAGFLSRAAGKGELNLHNLGQTRSSRRADHLLLTPDTFVRTPLPGMKGCTAVVQAGPALGAAFAQYTAEFEPGGELGDALGQRFVYVLEGNV